MKPFKTLTSKLTPLPIKDVDTDMIIPAQYLTRTTKEGYGEFLFTRLRGIDPNFPLNQAQYKGSKVLVADDNFGCGSSREHAVWALQDYGFDVVIAKSFADIFTGNSSNNGLLLITLKHEEIDEILSKLKDGANNPEFESNNSAKINSATINLEDQTVEFLGKKYSFNYDPFKKHCLINGLDTLDYILSKKSEIERFQEMRKEELSWGR